MRDYGCDPIGNNMYKMVPSGDIVDHVERSKRLPTVKVQQNDCLGLTWQQIALMQGGPQTLDITRQKKQFNLYNLFRESEMQIETRGERLSLLKSELEAIKLDVYYWEQCSLVSSMMNQQLNIMADLQN